MKIYVKYAWVGKASNNQPIHVGEYEPNDPRLFGLANRLLNSGHAIAVVTNGNEHTHDIAAALMTNDLGIEDDVVVKYDRVALAAEYEQVFGVKPHHNMKPETMLQRITDEKESGI